MFVFIRYSHDDVAYMECYGPFTTLKDVEKHANDYVANTYIDGEKLEWEPNGMFASLDPNPDECIIRVFELPYHGEK